MSTENNLTAVEWLQENSFIIPKTDLNKHQLIQQAKEMEKQQIIDAYCDGRLSAITKEIISYEQYYNQTFNK